MYASLAIQTRSYELMFGFLKCNLWETHFVTRPCNKTIKSKAGGQFQLGNLSNFLMNETTNWLLWRSIMKKRRKEQKLSYTADGYKRILWFTLNGFVYHCMLYCKLRRWAIDHSRGFRSFYSSGLHQPPIHNYAGTTTKN